MNKELKLLADKYGKRAVDDLKNKLLSDDTNASGDTLNSISYSIKGGNIVIEFDATINILDEGLNAGQRISESGSDGIVRWMKAKGLRPRFAKGTITERDYKASAFLIARAIKARGTIQKFGYKGSNILSLFDNNSSFVTDLTNDLGLWAQNEVDKLLNNI
jgi:hypothetical protein